MKRSREQIREAFQNGDRDFDSEETTGVIEISLEMMRESQEEHQGVILQAAEEAQSMGRALKNSTVPPPPNENLDGVELAEPAE